VAVLEQDPSAAIACTGAAFLDGDGRSIGNTWYDNACDAFAELGDLGLGLLHANFLLSTSNVVARRAAVVELGGFDDLRYAHDLDFFLRALAAGRRLGVIPRPLFGYRQHGANTVAEAPRAVLLERAAAAGFFAHRLRERRAPTAPGYLQRMRDVCDRQGLLAAVELAQRFARENPGSSPSALLGDAQARGALDRAILR
jgi:hypothetical protein